MRESTEGKWVNRIEELWIRIDDRNKAVGDTTRALFNAVAEKVTKAFNRIVGTRIISPRLVGISGSLSFTSLFLFFGLFFELLSYILVAYADLLKRSTPSADRLEHTVPVFILYGIVFLVVSLFCATFAILPIVFKSPLWAWLSCSPTILVIFLYLRLVYMHLASGNRLVLIEAFTMSLASDILLLMIIRQSLKWMLACVTLLRVTITMAIQLLLISIVIILPIAFIVKLAVANPKSNLVTTMLILGLFNIPTALASAAFVVLLFIVLLHRITWPLLSQWTYVLTRKDVLEKRKLLRTVAISLIMFGLSGIPRMAFVMKVVEKVFR
jgi:hypothetical protein